MWKEKDIIMLPTDKVKIGQYILEIVEEEIPNILRYGKITQEPYNCSVNNFHLYIISNEEIKEGDWCYYLNSLGGGDIIVQAYKHSNDKRMLYDDETFDRQIGEGITPLKGECKKIIATTDTSLIKECSHLPCKTYPKGLFTYLPQIPQQFISLFIEGYNKDNIIEKVEVEYEDKLHYENTIYKDVNKQTLKVSKDNFIFIRRKEKKVFTREEVVTKCFKMQHDYPKFVKESYYTPNMREIAEWTDNWIQQNL